MIKGEENNQFCKQCKKGPLRSGQYIFDFFNIVQCSEQCARNYRAYRDKEYDNYVDPLGYYQAKVGSKYD